MTEPSNKVHDAFRERSAGKVDAPFNSKPYCDNFHIDRSRLGTHEEYDAEAPNDWGGKGKYVETPNSIRRNAIGAMGDLRAKSSYREPGMDKDTGTGPNMVPGPYHPYGKNPMYKKRGGE